MNQEKTVKLKAKWFSPHAIKTFSCTICIKYSYQCCYYMILFFHRIIKFNDTNVLYNIEDIRSKFNAEPVHDLRFLLDEIDCDYDFDALLKALASIEGISPHCGHSLFKITRCINNFRKFCSSFNNDKSTHTHIFDSDETNIKYNGFDAFMAFSNRFGHC